MGARDAARAAAYSVERADGTIPRKYRKLIALGVAFTTQCAYCIDTHTRQAIENGAAEKETAEAAFVAALALRLADR